MPKWAGQGRSRDPTSRARKLTLWGKARPPAHNEASWRSIEKYKPFLWALSWVCCAYPMVKINGNHRVWHQIFHFLSFSSFFHFFMFLFPSSQNLFFFWPQLLHDFLQHFFTKIIFTSHLGEYSFEASFSFVLGFAMRTSIVLLSLGSRRPHFSSFSHVFYMFLYVSFCCSSCFFIFLHF